MVVPGVAKIDPWLREMPFSLSIPGRERGAPPSASLRWIAPVVFAGKNALLTLSL